MNRGQTPETKASPTDAISQLAADHQKVKDLFNEFEDIKADASKQEKGELINKISNELKVHEAVENDVFFPAVRDVLRDKDVLTEAKVEQDDAGEAIEALAELKAGEPGFNDKVTQLGKQIAAHAAAEEKDVFPKVQRSNVDTDKLGEQMAAHKAELKQSQD